MSNEKCTTSNNVNAKEISLNTRQQIAISALSGRERVSNISRNYGTSRKFVYHQKSKATKALDVAFSSKEQDTDVLFYIPVTKAWLHQVVLSLLLICHSSYGGIIEFFRDLFDHHICKGTIFNIVQSALRKAIEINDTQDLSSIKVGAHDEIFQAKVPVLVGCDVKSTYTYLLKHEVSRDATTWGVRLLELTDQGMNLDYTIADGGKGLRCGQKEAWPSVPCRGDVFHPLYDIGRLVTFLKNRAESTLETVRNLEAKMENAKKKNKGNKYSTNLVRAKKEAFLTVKLHSDISTLAKWLKQDILSVVGPDLSTRQELLQFVIEELKSREVHSPHRIRPVRRLLESQGKELLYFAEDIDRSIQELAERYNIGPCLVRLVFELHSMSNCENQYWELSNYLYDQLGAEFYNIQKEVEGIISETVRASSLVENLNSRLRNYFFLRKTLGNDYLGLLQFYLNHRRYMRSCRAERIGKSPKELLTQETHDHWLELLGFKLFKKDISSNVSVLLKTAA